MGLLKGLSRNYLRFSIGFIEPRLWQSRENGGTEADLCKSSERPSETRYRQWELVEWQRHMHTRTPIHTHKHRRIKRSRIQCQAGAETMRHDKSIFKSAREVSTQKILEMGSHRAGENWRVRRRKADSGGGGEESVHTSFLLFLGAHTLIFWDLPRCRQRQLR